MYDMVAYTQMYDMVRIHTQKKQKFFIKKTYFVSYEQYIFHQVTSSFWRQKLAHTRKAFRSILPNVFLVELK